MNKKQLYESIMTSVAKEVKKVLNETKGRTKRDIEREAINYYNIPDTIKRGDRIHFDKMNQFEIYEFVKNINWDLIETFIITNRKSGIPVSTYLIYLEILKQFDNSEIKISKHAIYERIYRFLERANYSIRVGTHIGQALPKDSLNLINIFHKSLKELCIYGINKIIENDLIVNIDETGLFLNLVYNNTIGGFFPEITTSLGSFFCALE